MKKQVQGGQKKKKPKRVGEKQRKENLRISIVDFLLRLDLLYNLRIYPGTCWFIVDPAAITFLALAGDAVKKIPRVPILPLAVITI